MSEDNELDVDYNYSATRELNKLKAQIEELKKERDNWKSQAEYYFERNISGTN